MNPKIYQDEAHKFASFGGNSAYPALGLAEESGEACGKLAKFMRKHDGDTLLEVLNDEDAPAEWKEDAAKCVKDLSKELGDVMWMVAELCTIYDLDLEVVMEENIAKLEDRMSRGVIIGEGDNR